MVSTRDKTVIKKDLVDYISSLGLIVKTATKARGNKGFFREGRIDVSKKLDDESCLRTLVHEYAHYVNYCLDKNINNLEILFKDNSDELREELQNVTNYVDENALCHKLYNEREKLKNDIKKLTAEIRKVYPDFKPSEDFKPFKKYTRWSDASYLEKYDRVKIHSWFSHKVYSVASVRNDFPDMPESFISYIRLRSKQRKRAKISRRITKMTKYYSEPCELFARFVEGLYMDFGVVVDIAPLAYEKFKSLYDEDYYVGLKHVFSILGVDLK